MNPFTNYKKNRLVVGGALGLIGCFVLLYHSHPVYGILVLLAGIISSGRAIFNGGPIIGLFLLKLNGVCLLLFPMLYAATASFRHDHESQSQSSSLPSPSPEELFVETPSSPSQVPSPIPQVRAAPNPEPPKATPAPQISPRPAPLSEREQIIKLVRDTRDLETGTKVETIMNAYADNVTYFGRNLSNTQIREDKEQYWKKWPVRTEEYLSEMEVSKPRHHLFMVTFASRFRNENASGTAFVQAHLKNSYILEEIKGRYLITSQFADVSKLATGGLEESKNPSTTFTSYSGQKIIIPERLRELLVIKKGEKAPQANVLALEAVNTVRLLLDAEEKRDIEATMDAFSYLLRYFGQDVSSEHVRTEKQKYFNKWPVASNKRLSKYQVAIDSARRVTVTLQASFSVSNKGLTLSRSGNIEHLFKLEKERGRLRIIEQSGKVTNLKTTKHQ